MKGIFWTLAYASVLSLLSHEVALGQAPYPSQVIKFVVPYSAGGLPDTVARVVARRLHERLGQPVVIENRPGANGGIAATALATSAADGYTFMVSAVRAH